MHINEALSAARHKSEDQPGIIFYVYQDEDGPQVGDDRRLDREQISDHQIRAAYLNGEFQD